jgi:diguanylate cyclase (GGDEF)-like protein/PAS domain S-box-containing protein
MPLQEHYAQYALSDDELRNVLHDGIGATISVVDRDWRFRYVNNGFARALKIPAADAVGRKVVELYGEETVRYITPHVERALAGETVTYERLGRIHEDESVWISVTISPWKALDGTVKGCVTSTLRVHELRMANERLHAATQRLASHVENSPLTVLELNAVLEITRCSARAEPMLGMAAAGLVGQSLLALLGNAPAVQPLKEALRRLQAGDDARSQIEAPFTKPNGDQVQLVWFNSAMASANQQDTSVMCLIEDVTTKRVAEQQLRDLVTHDPLTGLTNRQGLAENLALTLHEAEGNKRCISCLYLDLDGFKDINDQYGHAAGDLVLIEIARRLRSLVRAQDIVARLGGDEFVMVVNEPDDDAPYTHRAHRAATLANQVLQQLQAPCEFLVNGVNTQAMLSVSIGIASTPPHAADTTELLKRADAAMYEAKRSGKNCVRVTTT